MEKQFSKSYERRCRKSLRRNRHAPTSRLIQIDCTGPHWPTGERAGRANAPRMVLRRRDCAEAGSEGGRLRAEGSGANATSTPPGQNGTASSLSAAVKDGKEECLMSGRLDARPDERGEALRVILWNIPSPQRATDSCSGCRRSCCRRGSRRYSHGRRASR